MSLVLLVLPMLLNLPSLERPLGNVRVLSQADLPAVMTPDSIRGRTIRWTWTAGPTAGVTHEHEFRRDGTVEWRVLTGPQKGHAAVEAEYAAFEVSEEIYAISYLADSGYTLTVVLDFQSGTMYGFASGRGQWYPGRGTFEIAK